MQERFQNFTLFISKINRCIRKLKQMEMSSFELKTSHVFCLYYLYVLGPLTSKELCEVCEEDKAMISRSVEHLEKNGYVETDKKENRKYKRPIRLTENGRRIGKHLTERVDGILAVSSKGLSDEERETLYRALRIVSDNLQSLCDEYGI